MRTKRAPSHRTSLKQTNMEPPYVGCYGEYEMSRLMPLFLRDLHQTAIGVWRDVSTGILRDGQSIALQVDDRHNQPGARRRRGRAPGMFEPHDVAVFERSCHERAGGVLDKD